MKPETKFRITKVLPFLKTLKHAKFFAIQQLAIAGDPDYIICVRGRFIALELKKDEQEVPRPLQTYKLNMVRLAGGISIVAYPENWNEVKETLTLLDKGENVLWRLRSK